MFSSRFKHVRALAANLSIWNRLIAPGSVLWVLFVLARFVCALIAGGGDERRSELYSDLTLVELFNQVSLKAVGNSARELVALSFDKTCYLQEHLSEENFDNFKDRLNTAAIPHLAIWKIMLMKAETNTLAMTAAIARSLANGQRSFQ